MPGLSEYCDQIRSVMAAHETKLRFLLAGGLNTAFGLAVFPLLMLLLEPWQLHYLIVLAFSNALGIHFSYLTNKFFVFKTQGHSAQEYLKFISFYVVYFVSNLLILPLLVNGTGLSPIMAQWAYVFLVLVGSYFWHSRITFFQRTDS